MFRGGHASREDCVSWRSLSRGPHILHQLMAFRAACLESVVFAPSWPSPLVAFLMAIPVVSGIMRSGPSCRLKTPPQRHGTFGRLSLLCCRTNVTGRCLAAHLHCAVALAVVASSRLRCCLDSVVVSLSPCRCRHSLGVALFVASLLVGFDLLCGCIVIGYRCLDLTGH